MWFVEWAWFTKSVLGINSALTWVWVTSVLHNLCTTCYMYFGMTQPSIKVINLNQFNFLYVEQCRNTCPIIAWLIVCWCRPKKVGNSEWLPYCLLRPLQLRWSCAMVVNRQLKLQARHSWLLQNWYRLMWRRNWLCRLWCINQQSVGNLCSWVHVCINRFVCLECCHEDSGQCRRWC